MFRGLLLALCALVLAAPAAAADDDQIFVDPDSPSGKEYALPVQSARQAAAPTAAKDGSGGQQAAPLFGEGVRSAGASGSGAKRASRAGGSGGSGASSGGSDGGTPSGAAASAPATVRAQAATPDGGSALAVILGVGAGVLLAGGLIGLALRRRAAR